MTTTTQQTKKGSGSLGLSVCEQPLIPLIHGQSISPSAPRGTLLSPPSLPIPRSSPSLPSSLLPASLQAENGAEVTMVTASGRCSQQQQHFGRWAIPQSEGISTDCCCCSGLAIADSLFGCQTDTSAKPQRSVSCVKWQRATIWQPHPNTQTSPPLPSVSLQWSTLIR